METDRAYLLELEPMRFLAFFQKHAGLLLLADELKYIRHSEINYSTL
jgi:hypothetical protein